VSAANGSAGFALFLDAERVVEHVEEAAERNLQPQLYDLSLTEMTAQPAEQRLGDAACRSQG
jgi:hypothetical protein